MSELKELRKPAVVGEWVVMVFYDSVNSRPIDPAPEPEPEPELVAPTPSQFKGWSPFNRQYLLFENSSVTIWVEEE